MIQGLNHITLAVSDLENSLNFYRNILGFEDHVKWDNGAYLSSYDVWLCLSKGKRDVSEDYTHVAFSIDASQFNEMEKHLQDKGVCFWKENKSEGDSLYILDPDQHKLEIHVGSLKSRLESLKDKPYAGLEWL